MNYAETTVPEAEQLKRILSQIGRCVLLYQRIELQLKILLPHMHVVGTVQSEDTFANWRSLLDGKHTLGALRTRLLKCVEVDDQAGFSDYLETIVDDRNQIVHHFVEQSFGKLDSLEERREAMDFLQKKQKYALGLHTALEQTLSEFVTYLDTSIQTDEAH